MALKKNKDRKSLKWKQTEVDTTIKKLFKHHYKKKITSRKIQKVWKDFVEECITSQISQGLIVEFGSHVFRAKPIHIADNKRMLALLEKGLMYKNGRIVKAKLNFDTSNRIEKIVYENKDRKFESKLYFKAHKNIKSSVARGIISGKLVSRI